jgi:hypothetical protein
MANNITPLELTDTFATWFTTTNELIDNLNQMDISTATQGDGISLDLTTNGELNISLNLSSNSGLTIYSNKSLGIDLFGLPEYSAIDEDDYLLVEAITLDNTNNGNELKKVKATNILPLIINGNHIFSNKHLTDSYVSFETENLFLNSSNVLIENNYLTLQYQFNSNNDYLSRNEILAGLQIYTGDAGIIKYHYDGSVNAWVVNSNLGFSTNSKFINQYSETDGIFTFGLINDQTDISLRLQKTYETSDRYWEVFSNSAENKLEFNILDESSDNENVSLMYLKKLTTGEGGGSLVYINDKIYIQNISNSQQFKTAPTSTFTNYVVPLASTNGILDYKWTNRYVTSDIDGIVAEGDVVRIVTDTDRIRIKRANATSEENSNFIGIVERIYNGKYYVVLSGEFNASSSVGLSLIYGDTYYLSENAGEVTTIAPTSIQKPVLIATGTKTGILLSQSSGTLPNFKNIYIVDEHVTLEPSTANQNLSFVGGTGIGIHLNTNNEIEIFSDGSLGAQNIYKTINGYAATSQNNILNITGNNGILINNSKVSTTTQIEIEAPNSFGIIDIIADDTDGNEFTLNSTSSNDILQINAGTGIRIINHTTNGLTIEALGVSVPANGSVGNTQLANMGAYSVKASDDQGNPIDVSLDNFPNFYYNTDDHFYVENSTTHVYEVQLGEGPGGDGTPSSIAGFVVGRILDENGDISGVTALNRSDLRMLLGASPTGYLEENQNAFSIIDVIHNGETTTLNAATQTDILSFQSGTGIQLQAVDGTDGTSTIIISAASESYFESLGSGFNYITVPGDRYLQAGITGATINIVETDTILPQIGTTDSDYDLMFIVKEYSISNYHLAEMPANSIKANIDNSESNVTDLIVGEDSLVGRLGSGELKSLNVGELGTLLENNFFDRIVIEKRNGSSVTVTPDEDAGNLTLIEGSYISINNTGNGEVTISSYAPGAYGIKTIQTSDDSISRAAAALILDTTTQNYEILSGNIDLKPETSTSRQYNNIKLSYDYNSVNKNYRAIFDLEPMPACTVKCAGTDLDGSNYIPTNVYIAPGQVLGRKIGKNYVSSVDISEYKNSIGIYSYNTINITNESTDSHDDYIRTSQINSTLNLKGGYNIEITKEDENTILINAYSGMENIVEDSTPTLGGNLDINGKYFTTDGKRIVSFSASYSTSEIYFKFDNTTTPTISLLKEGVSGTSSKDMILTPYGAGYVQLSNGKLSTNASVGMYLKSGTGIFNLENASATENTIYSSETLNYHAGLNKKINFTFNTTNTKDLTFEKISSDVLMYTSSTNSNNLLIASKWNGSVSNGYVQFKANVYIDDEYCLTNDIGIVNMDGQFRINETGTFGGANENSVAIKKEKKTITSYGSATISGIPVDATAVIYEILIVDNNNTNIKRMFTMKVFNTDANGATEIDIYNERLSNDALTDTNINTLYFTKNSSTLSLNSTTSATLRYTVHNVMTIII